MDKDYLFKYLCYCTASISFGCDPKVYSAPQISRKLGVSTYRIRQLMHQLVSDGLVRRGHAGGMDEDGAIYCYHGYELTEEAKRTELYRRYEQKAIAEFTEWMGFVQSASIASITVKKDETVETVDAMKAAGISHYTINKLNHGDNVTTDVLGKICKALNCTMDDIMEFVDE